MKIYKFFLHTRKLISKKIEQNRSRRASDETPSRSTARPYIDSYPLLDAVSLLLRSFIGGDEGVRSPRLNRAA